MVKVGSDRIGIFGYVLFFVIVFVRLSFAGQAEDSASSISDISRGRFGTKDGIRQNIVNPIIQSNTPMRTLDGTKSFNAQMLCPSSKEYLQVFVQPVASGDLSTVIVRQDTNFDGSFDYSYRVPVIVSGVCGNGIISCQSGTWVNCSYYKWVASLGKISIVTASMSDLGGCYCINNSCGSTLVWNNLPYILKDIGGGVVGAIQAENPKMAISNVNVDGTMITYYGQDSQNCNVVQMGSGGANTKYYSNWAMINPDVQNIVAQQSANPNSMYSIISNSSYMQNRNSQVVECRISRSVACTDSSNYSSGRCSGVMSCSPGGTLNVARGICEAPATPLCREGYSLTNNNSLCKADFVCDANGIYDPLIAKCKLSAIYNCPSGYTYDNNSNICKADPICDSGSVYSTTLNKCSIPPSPNCPTGFVREGSLCVKPSSCPERGTLNNDSDKCEAVVSPSCPASEYRYDTVLKTCISDYKCNYGSFDMVTGVCSEPSFSNCPSGYTFNNSTVLCEQIPACTFNEQSSVSASDFIGFSEAINDRCEALERDNNCKLKEEKVDGVSTYLNYNPTGLSPLASCMTVTIQKEASCTISSSVCGPWRYTCPLDASIPCNFGRCVQLITHNVCRWWEKKRTYVCNTESYDFSDVQRRMASITSTTRDDITSVYYRDYRKDEKTGAWLYEDRNVGLGSRDNYSDCEKACKVRRPKADTQASHTGHTAQYRTNTQAFDFFYKPCPKGTCPVGAGEEIVKDCQCINEFAEAASIMQALRMAGQDMICSSGTPRRM